MAAQEVATIYATLALTDHLTPGLRRAESGLDGFGSRLSAFGGQLRDIGMNMTVLTAPLVAIGVQGVRTASDFDSAMAMISARTGIVGDDLNTIRDLALQMGADTTFSAQQAANAFLEILASGSSAAEAVDILPAVLEAAMASGEDLGQTADTVTDIMAAFGLEARDARRVVDALARAAGSSSADMGSLGEGFANVGGIANMFGLSVEETAAILAIFAENGIKGAEAGTQLRSMLRGMTANTVPAQAAWDALGLSMYDAQGNMRPLGDIMNDLMFALNGLTDEERIAATDALAGSFGSAGLIALTSSMSIQDMISRMDEQADTADIAATMMDTFSGRMDGLRGSIETAMIRAFTPFMNDVLTPLVGQITDVVNAVGEWAAANPEAANTIFTVVGAVALFGGGLTVLGTVITAVTGAIGSLLAVALGPLGLALIGGGLLVAAYMNNWGGFRDFIDNTVRPAIDSLIERLNELQDTLNNLLRTSPEGSGFGLWSMVPNPNTMEDRIRAQQGEWFGLPGRATGGPVSAGAPYMVGERGREMFVPETNGTIVPNHALGMGGGGDTYYIQMPAEALRDEATARQRGGEFAEEIMRRRRAIGYQR